MVEYCIDYREVEQIVLISFYPHHVNVGLEQSLSYVDANKVVQGTCQLRSLK